MKTINFYITPYKTFADCVNFCCKLACKAYQKTFSCKIDAESPELIEQLDHALWSQPHDHFIPHHINPEQPLQLIITHTQEKDQPPIWINCRSADKIASDFDWNRGLQVVPNDPELLQAARRQYRHYEANGATINTHKIG